MLKNNFQSKLIIKISHSLFGRKAFEKIEKQTNISINVFDYKSKTPYHILTSKQTFEKHVDLLLISNTKNSNCALIKNFNRFMTNKTKPFLSHCLQCFSSLKILKRHA